MVAAGDNLLLPSTLSSFMAVNLACPSVACAFIMGTVYSLPFSIIVNIFEMRINYCMALLEEFLPKNNIKQTDGSDDEFGFPLTIA